MEHIKLLTMRKLIKAVKSVEIMSTLLCVSSFVSAKLFSADWDFLGWTFAVLSATILVAVIAAHYQEVSLCVSIEQRKTSESMLKFYKMSDRVQELETINKSLVNASKRDVHAYIIISNGRVHDILPNANMLTTVIDLDIKRNFNKLGEDHIYNNYNEEYTMSDVKQSYMWEHINVDNAKELLSFYKK